MFNNYYNCTQVYLEILSSEQDEHEGITECEKMDEINSSLQLKLARLFEKSMSGLFLKLAAYLKKER